MWFCSYSYGALLGGDPEGHRSFANNNNNDNDDYGDVVFVIVIITITIAFINQTMFLKFMLFNQTCFG